MTNVKQMGKDLSNAVQHWWVLLVSGILFVALGFWVMNHPVASFLGLSIFFASGMLAAGLLQAYFSINNREHMEGWGWQLGLSVIEVVIAIILLVNPVESMAFLAFYIGFWLLFRAIYLVGLSFDFKSHDVPKWGWITAFGVLLGIFAILILIRPALGGATVVTWTALALIFAGAAQMFISFKLKKVKSKVGDIKEGISTVKANLKNEIDSLKDSNA